MAKSPAVLWYTGDYLVGVIGMTYEEQGRYTYLLNLQHQRGHLDIMAIMPDCPQAVLNKFVKDEDGLYYNERMEAETLKRDKFVESRRRNASNKTEAYAQHMENENRNENALTVTTTELTAGQSDNAGDTVKQVVEYLNSRAGTRYRANTEKTVSKIKARMNEGYTFDDFKRVIDNKCADWMGTDYQKFLRPETLFGPKFEGYLNQKPKGSGNTFLDLLQEWG